MLVCGGLNKPGFYTEAGLTVEEIARLLELVEQIQQAAQNQSNYLLLKAIASIYQNSDRLTFKQKKLYDVRIITDYV
ncbi:MAG: hypothetical protein AB4080_14555 [Trichodesmium sp.]